jgi:hypothetical protein
MFPRLALWTFGPMLPTSRRRAVLAATTTVMVLLGLFTIGPSLAQEPTSTRLPDEDRMRLEGSIEFGEPPTTAISREDALRSVAQYYVVETLGARSDEYLETVTILSSLGTSNPARNQPVWIVRLTEFELAHGSPINPDGSNGEVRYLHVAYVFIDAETSEFIMGKWQE